MKELITVSSSGVRGEVYIFLKDNLLFSLQGEQVEKIEKDILEDEGSLKQYILEEYGEVVEDILQQKEYYGKIVNLADFDYYSNLYKISLYNYDDIFYYVLADYEEEALEILVGHLVDEGETGHLMTLEEVEEDYPGEDENFVYVDCSSYIKKEDIDSFSYYLNPEHLFIKKIEL